MRQIVLTAPKQIDSLEVSIPVVEAGWVLAKTLRTGICGTDVHSYFGETIFGKVFPFHIGHEVCARVESVGTGVKHVAKGDIIAVNPFFTCGACSACYMGMENNCEHKTTIGLKGMGGFSEFVLIPETSAYKMESQDFDGISLVEPLATVIYGFSKLKVNPTSRLKIIGAGTIGLMFLQLAKTANVSQIIVADLNRNKLQKAMILGANQVLCPQDESFQQQNYEIAGKGYDVVIDCTGSILSMQNTTKEIGFGGQIMLFGISSAQAVMEINPFKLYQKDASLMTSFALNKQSFRKSAALIENQKIEVSVLIDSVRPITELEESIKEIAAGKADGKIVINTTNA